MTICFYSERLSSHSTVTGLTIFQHLASFQDSLAKSVPECHGNKRCCSNRLQMRHRWF